MAQLHLIFNLRLVFTGRAPIYQANKTWKLKNSSKPPNASSNSWKARLFRAYAPYQRDMTPGWHQIFHEDLKHHVPRISKETRGKKNGMKKKHIIPSPQPTLLLQWKFRHVYPMYYLLNMIRFPLLGRLLQCNSTHIIDQLRQLDTHWEIWEQPTYFCRG